ncbi:MAG: FG-GAP-like repeat-containing protein, partial [Pirellulales bacterium]
EINSATLRLYTSAPAATGDTLVYRLADANSAWREGSHDGGTCLGCNTHHATWAHLADFGGFPQPTPTWASGTGGPNVAGTDYDAVALGSLPNAGAVAGEAFDIPLGGDLTALFNEWASASPTGDGQSPWTADWNWEQPAPQTGNEGLLLRGTDGAIHDVYSSEAAAVNLRPQLIVNYDENVVPLATTESGGELTFKLALDTVPTNNVTIALSSSDLTEGTVAPASITFTPTNALAPQSFTITGVDDNVVDGDVDYTVIIAAAMSADPNYNGMDLDDFSVTNADDDTPDFGDAPTPYPVTLAENGGYHVATGPTLGADRDEEMDGIHSVAADADGNDEDGVFIGAIVVGALDASATVNVQNAPEGAKLDAWIDFNVDGSWAGLSEQIADSLTVVNGDNTISFDVPSWAADGPTYARFRLSTAGNLGMGGGADDGELEDYRLTINPPVETFGTFGGQNVISAAADGANSVFATDLDSDGDMDVLSTSVLVNKIAWCENDGNQNFTAHVISTATDWPMMAMAADVDGDGDMDVLSASKNDNMIAWYENDGNQNFTQHPISTDAQVARSVFAADVDSDGDMDVLSASRDDDKIAWYENDGNQNFAIHIISSTADGARSVSAADVDSDGDMDVLSASESDDTIAWYENDGSQNFTPHTISAAADFAYSVLAADVNGDGHMDVLSASYLDDKIAWYENDGSGAFTPHTISDDADGAISVFAADEDGDGDIDVISASYLDDEIRWYENDGSGAFTPHTISTAADGAIAVFAADLEGDGDLDILSASYNDDKLAWYENNPNQPPTGVALANKVNVLVENADTGSRIKLADIQVVDDAQGTNEISLAGADAASFEVDGNELYLKAGEVLDFESQVSYDVTVSVEDSSVAGSTPVTADFTLNITDVNEAPAVALTNVVNSLAENADTSAAIKVADIAIGDDALGTNNLSLSGADAAAFE